MAGGPPRPCLLLFLEALTVRGPAGPPLHWRALLAARCPHGTALMWRFSPVLELFWTRAVAQPLSAFLHWLPARLRLGVQVLDHDLRRLLQWVMERDKEMLDCPSVGASMRRSAFLLRPRWLSQDKTSSQGGAGAGAAGWELPLRSLPANARSLVRRLLCSGRLGCCHQLV